MQRQFNSIGEFGLRRRRHSIAELRHLLSRKVLMQSLVWMGPLCLDATRRGNVQHALGKTHATAPPRRLVVSVGISITPCTLHRNSRKIGPFLTHSSAIKTSKAASLRCLPPSPLCTFPPHYPEQFSHCFLPRVTRYAFDAFASSCTYSTKSFGYKDEWTIAAST